MPPDPKLTKSEAKQLLTDSAWQPKVSTCGHTGCTDHIGPGAPMIHSFTGTVGATWELEEALSHVDRAQAVGWMNDPFDHDLAVIMPEGKVIRFDVSRRLAHVEQAEA